MQTKMTVRVQQSWLDEVKHVAIDQHTTVSQLIKDAVALYIDITGTDDMKTLIDQDACKIITNRLDLANCEVYVDQSNKIRRIIAFSDGAPVATYTSQAVYSEPLRLFNE